MFDKLQRKLVNVFIFLDLTKMEKRCPITRRKWCRCRTEECRSW